MANKSACFLRVCTTLPGILRCPKNCSISTLWACRGSFDASNRACMHQECHKANVSTRAVHQEPRAARALAGCASYTPNGPVGAMTATAEPAFGIQISTVAVSRVRRAQDRPSVVSEFALGINPGAIGLTHRPLPFEV